MDIASPRTSGTHALRLIRKIAEAGHRIFTPGTLQEVAQESGLQLKQLNEALHRLARDGWIVRLRRGLYSLSSQVFRETPLHEFEIAMALVEPAAISHRSAMNFHGLTEQISQTVYVLTTTEAALPRERRKGKEEEGHVDLSRYRFIQIRPARFFGTEKVWVGESAVSITTIERTLLDGLEKPRYCGDFGEVLHAFQVAIRDTRLNLDRLIDHACRLDTATAKRTGWVLERLGVESARLLRLMEMPINGYRSLDPSGPGEGRYNPRWGIQENLPSGIPQ